MNKQIIQELKGYNLYDKLKVNYYLDAKQSHSWKVGQIVSIRHYGHRCVITVKFDGYPSRWNEDFDLPASNKLAPFRRYTVPYTGLPHHSPIEMIRPSPEMNFQPHMKELTRLTHIDKIKPEFMNQYFRGELFILIDNLLTMKTSLTKDDYPKVRELLRTYIGAAVKFLTFAHEAIKEIGKESITDPNIIYVSSKYAALYSLSQWLFNLNSMISEPRRENRVKFHQVNEIRMKGEESIAEFKKLMRECKVGEHCKFLLEFQNAPYRGYPWSVKKEALILLKTLTKEIDFPPLTDNRQVIEFLDYLTYIKNNNVFSIDFLERKQVELVVSLMKAGNFQGKLKGVNQLKKLVEQTSRFNKQIIKSTFTKSQLLNMLTDNNTFSGEIFKRSIPIFQFSYKNNLFDQEHFRRIISLHKDKHELELKNFYSALSEFGRFLDKKQVIQFFNQLAKLPLDQHLITLIKDYTLNVIDCHPHYKKKYSQKGEGFGTVFFWQLIEKNPELSTELRGKVIEGFCCLLVNLYYKPDIQNYITQAIYSIKDGKNVDSYLMIIHTSLKLSKAFKISNTIKLLEKQINIIDAVIKAVLGNPNISAEAMENMFEFLEQVDYIAKKGMTVDHIKHLWKLESCRNPLLKFLRKFRITKNENNSHEKIILKQLGEAKIKEIADKIFLIPEHMNGYKSISNQLYQTVDELLASYNHQMKYIDYNYKHTIRCYKHDSLYGLEFYLNVGRNADEEMMRERALRRFVQYHIRPINRQYHTDMNLKVNTWLSCAEKLLAVGNQAFRGIKLLLEEIEGRMKSLNILQPSVVDINVNVKGTNTLKTISLPRFTSIWKLRQVIGEEFKMKDTNFDIFYAENPAHSDMQKQQDFSLAYIKIPKDPMLPAIIVTPTKEAHPHQQAITAFKTNLSNKHGEYLFKCLEGRRYEQQFIILNILNVIPGIKILEKKMQKMDGKTNWEEILDSTCRMKLAYQLKVIKNFKSSNWALNFIKCKGVQHFQKIISMKNQKCEPMRQQFYDIFKELLIFFTQILKFYKTMNSPLPFGENFAFQLMSIPQKDKSTAVAEYYYHAFHILKELASYPQIQIKKLFQDRIISEILETTLFSKLNSQYSKKLPNILVDLTISNKSNMISLLLYQVENFMEMQFLLKNKYSCEPYFNLLTSLINKNYMDEKLFSRILSFAGSVTQQKQYFEEESQETNQMINGWLGLMKLFFIKNNSFSDKIELLCLTESQYAKFILHECLFEEGHRLKSEKTRQVAYQILSNIDCQKQINQLLYQTLVPLMTKGAWRKQNQWAVKAFHKRKTGYVGMKNLTATCYLNSLIQQLFFIKKFRENLLSFSLKNISDKENIAYELQKIFAHLKNSDSDIFIPLSFCNTFILDGQPIDPRIQTDVDEFFHTLMDKLERNLIHIQKKDLIDDIFRGEYSNLIIGQECPHKSERVEHFLSMRLEIIQKKSLSQALEEFIKGEILEGDNAYFCDKCDKKVKALKRVCVKNLPEILILTLKRFQFNFDTMQRFKLNTFCEFPEELDMLPYTREALFQDQEKMPAENYRYRLKGILIHFGISEAGHYTSYIKTGKDQWKYFDDEKVSDFNIHELAHQCFGGMEENPFGDDEEKIKNAYLLFYEKITAREAEEVIVKTESNILSEVAAENAQNQLIKILFEDPLQKYLTQNISNNEKLYLLYVHLIALRSEKRARNLTSMYDKCQQLLSKDKILASWYLNQINESFLREFVIYGCFEVRYFVASLICRCISMIVDTDFIKRCLKCLEKRNMVPLNKIFQTAANSHQSYYKKLGEYSLQDKIYKIIKEDKEPSISNSLAKMEEIKSEFGYAASQFSSKKDSRDSVELFQAIEKYKPNISLESLEFYAIKAKKILTQKSLAKILTNKYKDKEGFSFLLKNFIFPKLIKFEPKIEEEHVYNFVLILIKAYCDAKDNEANERIKLLAQVYIEAIKDAIEGYKAMRMLIEGLFNTGFNNAQFRDEIVGILTGSKQGKRILKMIKDWIKEGDRYYTLVRNQRVGYWKKPKRLPYTLGNQLHHLEKDEKIKPDHYLSLLNTFIEKHKSHYQDRWSFEFNEGKDVFFMEYGVLNRYKIVASLGLLLEISNSENIHKFVFIDDVISAAQ